MSIIILRIYLYGCTWRRFNSFYTLIAKFDIKTISSQNVHSCKTKSQSLTIDDDERLIDNPQGNIANPPRCAIMRVLFLVVNNADDDDAMWFWEFDAFPFSVNKLTGQMNVSLLKYIMITLQVKLIKL